MKKLVLIGLALAAAYFGGIQSGLIPRQDDARTTTSASSADRALAAAFENRSSNAQVQGSGHVTRILPDDNSGSRHQRFIVGLASGQTVLVAHNIDLAGRVAALKTGDLVEFYGEYEWNERGGVVHWTHRDPQHGHADGWIKHNGHTYQ
ncbi:MAG TPA: DUF3465 domain-containing protein [Burkholderiales bacterium]|nr:DUF3465 domain-containing protein [Burkholderiales bacterium]